MSIPGWLLQHTVTIEPYLGQSANGPKYGPGVSVKGFLEQLTKEVRNPAGEVVVSSSQFYCRLGSVAPPESRATLPDGQKTRVIAAQRHDGGSLGTPNHLELQLV